MTDKLIITLSGDKAEIYPGKKTEIKFSISNTGDVTESCSITLEGIDPGWYTLSAQSISLPPADKAELTLTVKPPLISSGEAEKYTAILKVTSERDSSITTTLPVEMRVGSLLEFELRLNPQKQKGRKGSFTVNITNKGDKAATYDLEGKDPYNACRYEFSQKSINLQAGESGRVSLSVIPKERPFRGSVRNYEFKVSVAPQGGLPYQSRRVTGELTYKPVLRTIPAFILIMTVIIVAGAINAFSSIDIDNTASLPYYNLRINMDGKGTFSGAGTYRKGTVVSISVSYDSYWEFVEWTGDTDVLTNPFSNSNQIVVNGNYTLTARLEPLMFPPTSISNLVLNPQSPAIMNYGDWVKLDFEYITNVDYSAPNQDDVFILARPMSNGSLTPGYLSESSPIQAPWQSEGKGAFTINPQHGEVRVDQIRFQIINAGTDFVLYEFFFPVDYTFIQDFGLQDEIE